MEMSTTELAGKMKVSVTAVRNWRIAGMPFTKNAKGQAVFDLSKVKTWLQKAGKKGGDVELRKKARLALEVFQAKLLKHKLEKKQSQHVRTDDVEHAAKQFKERLRKKFEGIPGAVTKALKAKGVKADFLKVEKIISQEIGEALKE